MGKHIPVVEEGWTVECVEGECEHETPDECLIGVVACSGCLETVELDPSDDTYAIPEWPCVHSTHYPEPMMRDLKAQLLREWAEGRPTTPDHLNRSEQ
ncbi:hypothetical protein [Leifsonia poae]|uniref:hypothetical protein n=1 Tax=Leifsonia poae TaxID=110933 RepID=UPI001CBDAC57|nr:hypothetical protein [Leifsonia poae]